MMVFCDTVLAKYIALLGFEHSLVEAGLFECHVAGTKLPLLSAPWPAILELC